MPKLVVIGSGVFGAWTALLAQRSGYETTLLDSRGRANERSSSTGESRIHRLAYGADELYTRFAARALHLWKAFFAAEGCPECFKNTGALWITNENDPKLHQVESIFTKLCITHEYLSGEHLVQQYPQFSFKHAAAAILEPESGALLAGKAVRTVFEACLREGVFYQQEAVLPPNTSGRQLTSVRTASGASIGADLFVFAAGAWLPRLFPDILGHCIFPTRQELFFFKRPKDDTRYRSFSMPVWIDQSRPGKIAYGFPDIDDAGVKIAFHELGPAFDPDSADRQITDEQVQEAARALEERFPALCGAPLLSAKVCPYENTSTGDFLVDQHPHWSNTWFLGGGSGHGFKHGPAVAEYLLDVMRGNTEPEARFSLRAKGSVLQREVV